MGITGEDHLKLQFMCHMCLCVRPGALCVPGSHSTPPLCHFKGTKTASHYTLITVSFYYAVSEVCIRFPSASSVLFHNWSRVPTPPRSHTMRVEWEQASRPLQLRLGRTKIQFSFQSAFLYCIFFFALVDVQMDVFNVFRYVMALIWICVIVKS